MRKSKSLLLSLIVAAGLTTLMGANVFADSSLKELTDVLSKLLPHQNRADQNSRTYIG
jgi:hypothetical protein